MSKKTGGWLESIKTVVYAGLIAVGIRTVGFEPFNIPSGSMIPTLLVGDYLFVSKYAYGYSKHSIPFSPDLFSGRVFGSLPERGDVAVFKFPRDNTTDYIKRIIGLPGDHIQMRSGRLFVNGREVPRESMGPYTVEGDGPRMTVRLFHETLPPSPGSQLVQHRILEATDDGPYDNTAEFVVPPGNVFAMGDNRDNSLDSRDMDRGVGFVPLENLVGRAEMIFFSVDGTAAWWEVWDWPFAIRWSRLFQVVR